ncbi:hypothetical protein EVAR_15669_1 [Eumeta japonica]|uniref:Uncharacterized protein n=1 Tax=Eumeta variegata TaxID=151549 RepID=A0A4C1U9B8_EUMVA|nr:hypothetical protein EVAR_15669_1 [Eumeta japonica]
MCKVNSIDITSNESPNKNGRLNNEPNDGKYEAKIEIAAVVYADASLTQVGGRQMPNAAERGGRLCLFVARSALSLALQTLNGTPQSEITPHESCFSCVQPAPSNYKTLSRQYTPPRRSAAPASDSSTPYACNSSASRHRKSLSILRLFDRSPYPVYVTLDDCPIFETGKLPGNVLRPSRKPLRGSCRTLIGTTAPTSMAPLLLATEDRLDPRSGVRERAPRRLWIVNGQRTARLVNLKARPADPM